MATILTWNEKELNITSSQIYTFSGWTSDATFETSTDDSGKKKKGSGGEPGMGSVSFEIILNSQLGLDVQKEYYYWRNECSKGTDSLLYIGPNQFGSCKWRLVGVSQSELITFADGTWKKCRMTLTFEESTSKIKLTKEQKKVASLSKKLEKQIKKAENAKTEKAREKAATKAAKLQKQLEENQIKVAQQQAAAAKKRREDKEKTASLIAKYYSEL